MAQKFLSPGVFTTEVDQSFLAQGVAGIGAAMLGRTLKGPAFLPLFVDGFDAFAARFGATDPKLQMPYCAKNYLKNSTSLTGVRVLGHRDGTSTSNGYLLGAVVALADSGSNGQVLAEVHVQSPLTASAEQLSDGINFVFRVKNQATLIFAATASFMTASQNYIGKVLNTDPTLASSYGHYVYKTLTYVTPNAALTASVIGNSGNLSSFDRDYEAGVSAWVKSQPIGGIDFNLFRFHSLLDGREGNDDFKVMVANVKPSPSPTATPFGTFDIVIRDFYDTDQRQVVLESFVGCSLDPDSPSYILRKIGDKHEVFDTTARKFVAQGTFPGKSKYVYVELDTTVNPPDQALPWGHRGYLKLNWVSGTVTPDMPLQPSQFDKNGNQDPNICFGITFVSGGIVDRMRAFPNNATSDTYEGSDADFSLGYLTSSYFNGKQVWSYNSSIAPSQYHQAVYASASLYKFNLPMQGGFDGWDLRVADPLYLTNVADETSIGVVSLKRAIDCIANPDAFDLNLLAIPGIHNLKVTDYARNMVNARQDAMFVMDVTGSSVAEVIGNLKNRELDDNYTATYYPDLQLNDKNSNKIVRVSPSVAVMGAIAFSDRVGQVFFAPAGLNRGGLADFDIIDVADRLTFQDRNDLYDNRINPIASFPNEGIVIFGQKTLQVRPSALDRVNVRRLLIFAKKTIASAAKYLLFEPNNPQTWQRFTNTVNPILAKVQQNQGLVRFKVVMDTTTNTDDLIDRNIMTGKIFLQPTKAAEFIDLSFIITNAGVSFGE